MTGGRIKRDIIDNAPGGFTMKRVLCSEIPHADRLDVSTGYFDVAGYGMLRKELEAAARRDQFSMRLLLGKGSLLSPPAPSFEQRAEQHAGGIPDPSRDDPPTVKAALDAADLGREYLANTASLIALLEMSNVQVRLGPRRFNHSKCYILGDDSVFIGSSNLTAGGMVGNYELNAGLYQPGVAADTREWFNRMWGKASDAKGDLLRVLRQSKFGIPPSPHDIYMKMLFEKYRHLLRHDGHPRGGGARLTAFQRDAVDTAAHIMGAHGGAIIADSTGLGKTNMGIEIMRQKMLDEERQVMLVAPAQVLRSVWAEKLKEAGIAVRRMVTMEAMGREGFVDDTRKYRNIDLVVVDESQNFRSKNAQRRQNLMRVLSIGAPKQVLLLTATPINNSLMDLYYQLSIITKESDDYFWEAAGIADLHRHMRDATNKDLDSGLGKIQQLLDTVMVRRTRSFIRDVYKDDEINGRRITFPDHEYKPVKYDMAGLYGDIFTRLYDDILSLTMAPYSPERYNTGLPQDERDRHTARAYLQVVLLLKRFESSTEAVRTSIRNKIRMYEHVERALRNGRMLRVREFNAALARWGSREIDGEDAGGGGGDGDPEGEFVRLVGDIAEEDAGWAYDIKAMLADTSSDLVTLRALGEAVDRVAVDKKFEAVRDTIIADGALDREGRKVLLFTEYAATARHLHKKLAEAFAGKNVQLIHGSTGPDSRQDIIRRFAPAANLPDGESLGDGEREADILVSTEVLSEGQNLQDCNYVVNYDLPWNPMRIVQRTGRVDRLTSRHKTVRTRACYPASELDGLLKLVGRLMEKIDVAGRVVGTDVEILGRLPNPKEFNGRMAMDVRALAGQGAGADSVIRRLEAESDMMPQTTPLNEIMRHVKEIGLGVMGEVPMGRRSGRRGEGQRAVLAYLQEGKEQTRRVHFVVYDYATDRAEAAESDADALRLASCARDEPTHLPMDGADHCESFEELLRIDRKARQAIADRGRSGAKMVADVQQKRKAEDRDIPKLQKILIGAVRDGGPQQPPPGGAGAAGDDRLPEEDANEAYRLLGSDQFRLWRGQAHRLLAAYEADGDARRLANEILRFGRSIYAEDRAGDAPAPAPSPAGAGRDGAARLTLIGAQFVMGEYDPRLGQKGLDRHAG